MCKYDRMMMGYMYVMCSSQQVQVGVGVGLGAAQGSSLALAETRVVRVVCAGRDIVVAVVVVKAPSNRRKGWFLHKEFGHVERKDRSRRIHAGSLDSLVAVGGWSNKEGIQSFRSRCG